MAGSTWIWNGGSAAGSTTNWTLLSGPGNPNQHPKSGDTGIVPDGTVSTGSNPNFQGNTIEIGGTAGTTAALTVSGGTFSNFGTPSADATTLISSAVPGHTTPELSALDAGGTFINEGTILADGPAGSVFTINVAQTTAGTATLPGYFFNAGTIEAETGNTLIINVGSDSALLNTGEIVADGGTVVVNVATGAIAGGDAPVRGFEVVEGGGTLITAASYPAGDANNGTRAEYQFGDSTPGNTLKIENIGSFGGVIIGFAAGDTIDLGSSLTVGTLAYSTTTNLLSLEAANGTTLASLILGNFGTGLATGSFPLIGGVANGITVGVGADGDTVLTTAGTLVTASGISGAWQSDASWLSGVVPGASASALIGLGAAAPFTLTTGSTPVSVGGFGIDSALATVEITSDTTLTTGQANDYAGTLDIASGATLTAAAIQLYEPSASLTIAAGATADLAGRINLDLAPSGGIWAVQPGGHPYAFLVSAGTAVIDGALLAGPSSTTRGGNTSIGYDSADQPATVIVNAGGTVTDTHATLGSDLTSSGTLIVNGPGASWTDEIDPADASNSRGYITVGYNDLVADIPAGLTDPLYVAPAQVLVENGATLTDQEAGYIGDTPDSAGNVTVETGGLWDLSSTASNGAGFVNVGQFGSGTLSVLAGGSVELGSLGTFISNGTSFTGGGMGIGMNAGSDGTVIVDGTGAQISTLNGIGVGKAGQGLLEILNGGAVLMKVGNLSIGTVNDGVSSGTVVVGGPGSAAFLNFGTAAGGLTVGGASQGTLIVADNGTINLNNANFLTIGGSSTATGAVVVGGTTTSAVINLGTAGLTVGNAGIAYLTVQNHGTITMAGTRAIQIGQSAGAGGTITVSGAAAALTASGGINVGRLGQATLDVQNGATVGTSNVTLDGQPSGPLDNLFDLAAVTTGGRLEATGALFVWQGSTVSVDSSAGSGVDVGTSGAYVTGAINLENGHSLVGNGLIAAAVVSDGLIEASGTTAPNSVTAGTLEIQGTVTGSGIIDIGANASVRLDAAVAVGQGINFSPGGAHALILNAPGNSFGNAITGLSVGDKIEFGNGMTVTSASVVNVNTIAVEFHGSGGLPGTYDLADVGFASGSGEAFSVGVDASTGDSYVLVQNALCFLAGTLIGTPDGQVAVERLVAGDLVRTASGAVRPVVWVGHGRVLATRGRRGPATPVIVRKGALGANVPHTDLHVTKGHSFLLDGVLIPVEFLVNHRSILWDDRAQEVSVYHVELQTHDVLVANGAAAESYRDDGNRWLFGNANAGWDQPAKPPCAAVLTGGPVVDAVWRRLLEACGPRPSVPLTEDADVHLLVDGTRLEATARTGDVLVFALPPAVGCVRLMSRSAAPQELGLARDPRSLGVAVRRVVLRQGTRFRTIRADDPLLAAGFHPFEAATGLRWTDGDAPLPAALLDNFPGPCEVVIHLGGTARYIDDGNVAAVA